MEAWSLKHAETWNDLCHMKHEDMKNGNMNAAWSLWLMETCYGSMQTYQAYDAWHEHGYILLWKHEEPVTWWNVAWKHGSLWPHNGYEHETWHGSMT
jgi:hypothetical protein